VWNARNMVIAAIGGDLLLWAIDARVGLARFRPKLSYALPVAEMVHLVHTGRAGLRADHLAIMNPEPTGEPLANSVVPILLRNPPLTTARNSPIRAWTPARAVTLLCRATSR
jgi:hypothetical protein